MPRERRAAIYLRVSSEEQTYENQRPDVQRLARTRGYEVVATYEEQASAVKTRPEYTRMMRDAHRGMFDVLAVWALDRFGRSMVGNMQAVLELDHRGVEVVSVREPWLDTGGAVRPLLIAIFSWVAEQERSRLSERTRAGMERARRDGVLQRSPRMVRVCSRKLVHTWIGGCASGSPRFAMVAAEGLASKTPVGLRAHARQQGPTRCGRPTRSVRRASPGGGVAGRRGSRRWPRRAPRRGR